MSFAIKKVEPQMSVVNTNAPSAARLDFSRITTVTSDE
jgi:hypothetical protein